MDQKMMGLGPTYLADYVVGVYEGVGDVADVVDVDVDAVDWNEVDF